MHPSKRILLIVEAKTSLGDVQDLLGRLDAKVRMGAQIAKQIGGPSLRALSRACSWPMDGQHAEWWPRIPNCSRASRIVAGPRIAGSPRQPRTKASVGC
jgi:hypothetical protein